MKRRLLFAALLSCSFAAQAHDEDKGHRIGCNVGSDYGVSPHRRAFLFTNADGQPREIGLGGGRLFIDGKEQRLAPADHQRLRQLESEMQLLVPEVRRVATEAIDIAFTAMTEVARGLATDPAKTVANLESARGRVRAEMQARPLGAFNEDVIEKIVAPLIGEYLPEIIGGAVSSAVKAAFTGEKNANEFEQRIKRMERELDRKVEVRAKALEPLADAMCTRLQRMDAIDDSLEFRLPSGEPIQFLRVESHDKN